MGQHVIIIGAGAAGLYAARRLCSEGMDVTVLEAAARPGGRIHTIGGSGFATDADGGGGTRLVVGAGFKTPVEGGAEFIHGDLPLTLGLAKEAGVPLLSKGTKMFRLRKGQSLAKREPAPFPSDDWDLLLGEMGALTSDIPMADFLAERFPGQQYEGLRASVRGFAEGYDLADLRQVSTLSLYKEWSSEEDANEYRVEGGYGRLIDFLVESCVKQGCRLHFSSPVAGVRWLRGRVEVRVADGRMIEADRLIITASLGTLKAGDLVFDPALPRQEQAIGDLGYGEIIKALLEFRAPFWSQYKPEGQTLFIVSQETAPTWWTQEADDCGLITCWIAGEAMRAFRELDPAGQMDSLLGSLGAIFSMDRRSLEERLTAMMVLDWLKMPYFRGGYSFETVRSAAARAILSQPVQDTIYFSGEALYEGSAPGTVEAAFSSGLVTAEALIAKG
jgi:monoamine oxidase